MRYVEEAMKVRGINPASKLVLVALANYADQFDGLVIPGWGNLVADTGLSRSSIGRSLNALMEAGLVNKSTEQSYKSTRYVLVLGAEAREEAALTMGLTSLKVTPLGTPKALTVSRQSPSVTPNYKEQGTSSRRKKKVLTYLRAFEPSGPSRSGTNTIQEPGSAMDISHGESEIIAVGWPSQIEARAREAKGQQTTAQEEAQMPMPGFELDEEPRPRRRGEVDDTDHLARVGYLGKRPEVQTKAPKPVKHWGATDFYAELNRRAKEAAPGFTDQIPRGWCLGTIARWLKEGTSPEAIMMTIDWFFIDKGNFRDLGSPSIWQRYRAFHIQNQGRAKTDLGRRAPGSSATKVDWDALAAASARRLKEA